MKRKAIPLFLAAALALAAQARGAGQTTPSDPHGAKPPLSVRLYVIDCGTLHIADLGRFNLSKEEVATTDLSVACFLVVHPRGTLVWDTGAVPDTAWTPSGSPVTQHIVLPDSQQRDVTMIKPMKAQLAELRYSPSGITYLALSHYHYDHTANANEFAGATWLVRQVERDAMFGEKPPGTTQPAPVIWLLPSLVNTPNSTAVRRTLEDQKAKAVWRMGPGSGCAFVSTTDGFTSV